MAIVTGTIASDKNEQKIRKWNKKSKEEICGWYESDDNMFIIFFFFVLSMTSTRGSLKLIGQDDSFYRSQPGTLEATSNDGVMSI